jgi:hypothetical protein
MVRSKGVVIVSRASHRTLLRRVLACVLLLACLLPFAGSAPAASRDGAELPSWVGAYQAAAFSFKVTIEDDGEGVAGGWQEATASLVFVRPRAPDPDGCYPDGKYVTWRCPMTVGLPVRSVNKGKISTKKAAEMAADAATVAEGQVKWGSSDTEETFCKKFRTAMQDDLNKPKPISARVTLPR